MELLEKLAQPAALGDGVGDNMVICFRTGVRDGGLALGRLRHQVVTEVDAIAQHGAAGVGAPQLVHI
jgi:hypothetical protein